MKKYTLSFANSLSYKHEFPDRTARRSLSDDVTFQVWPSRKAMAVSIRMQQKGASTRYSWTPLVPLSDGEGY